MSINIQNVSILKSLPDNEKIEFWVKQALDEQHKDAEISFRIVDEEEGKLLNKNWRNKDYATNVLSFPVGEIIEHAPNFLGDIVICAPVVEREAKEQEKDIDAHWAHLVIHGVLHLQGYDHEVEKEAEKMEAMEISILNKIGYTNPYETELQE